jgi:hypothetical protein
MQDQCGSCVLERAGGARGERPQGKRTGARLRTVGQERQVGHGEASAEEVDGDRALKVQRADRNHRAAVAGVVAVVEAQTQIRQRQGGNGPRCEVVRQEVQRRAARHPEAGARHGDLHSQRAGVDHRRAGISAGRATQRQRAGAVLRHAAIGAAGAVDEVGHDPRVVARGVHHQAARLDAVDDVAADKREFAFLGALGLEGAAVEEIGPAHVRRVALIGDVAHRHGAAGVQDQIAAATRADIPRGDGLTAKAEAVHGQRAPTVHRGHAQSAATAPVGTTYNPVVGRDHHEVAAVQIQIALARATGVAGSANEDRLLQGGLEEDQRARRNIHPAGRAAAAGDAQATAIFGGRVDDGAERGVRGEVIDDRGVDVDASRVVGGADGRNGVRRPICGGGPSRAGLVGVSPDSGVGTSSQIEEQGQAQAAQGGAGVMAEGSVMDGIHGVMTVWRLG